MSRATAFRRLSKPEIRGQLTNARDTAHATTMVRLVAAGEMAVDTLVGIMRNEAVGAPTRVRAAAVILQAMTSGPVHVEHTGQVEVFNRAEAEQSIRDRLASLRLLSLVEVEARSVAEEGSWSWGEKYADDLVADDPNTRVPSAWP
jgi:hypothetical protein